MVSVVPLTVLPCLIPSNLGVNDGWMLYLDPKCPGGLIDSRLGSQPVALLGSNGAVRGLGLAIGSLVTGGRGQFLRRILESPPFLPLCSAL